MIVRTEHGLKAIAQRPNTIVRIWSGTPKARILEVEHPELESGDECFEVLTRVEAASWGSAIYRVREDRSLHCLDGGE